MRLRQLDIRPIQHDGQKVFWVRDPLGYAPDGLLFPPELLRVALLFNGFRDLSQIASASGLDLPSVQRLYQDFKSFHLLEDAEFDQFVAEQETAFLASGLRPYQLAGRSYPLDPQELVRFLDGLYTRPEGPGQPDAQAARPGLGGIVVPHIDLRLGGGTYAHAYKALQEAPAADVYVILGIGHAGLAHGVSLCPLDFDTPLGRVPVDRAICDELTARCGEWLLADQAVQRQEHSIEFQVVMLKHSLRHPFRIVPLLTAFGPDDIDRGGEMDRFFQTLRQVLADSGKRILVVASVDFSHVGPMYGDSEHAGSFMEQVRDKDRRVIEALEKADDVRFWEAVHTDRNRFRICGYPAMWGLLQLTQPDKGQLLAYHETVMDQQDSRVSFASLIYPA